MGNATAHYVATPSFPKRRPQEEGFAERVKHTREKVRLVTRSFWGAAVTMVVLAVAGCEPDRTGGVEGAPSTHVGAVVGTAVCEGAAGTAEQENVLDGETTAGRVLWVDLERVELELGPGRVVARFFVHGLPSDLEQMRWSGPGAGDARSTYVYVIELFDRGEQRIAAVVAGISTGTAAPEVGTGTIVNYVGGEHTFDAPVFASIVTPGALEFRWDADLLPELPHDLTWAATAQQETLSTADARLMLRGEDRCPTGSDRVVAFIGRGLDDVAVTDNVDVAGGSNHSGLLYGDGLATVPFGTDSQQAERELSERLGAADRASDPQSGMEFAVWGDLWANFRAGRFVGWSLAGPDTPVRLATPEGVTHGTREADVRAAYPDATFQQDDYDPTWVNVEVYVRGSPRPVRLALEASVVVLISAGEQNIVY